MTTILLMRHGETAWNRERVFRGRAEVPLSPRGVAQARALAQRLAEEAIEAVYSSPLGRALDTASHVATPHGLSPTAVEDLTDASFGEWEGMPEGEVKQRYAALYEEWRTQPHLVRPPGGETLAEVRARATVALRKIAASHPGGAVAVVAHRVVNKVILCAALGLGDEGFWRIRQDTGCLNTIEREGERWVVVLVNDTCHLRHLERDAADF